MQHALGYRLAVDQRAQVGRLPLGRKAGGGQDRRRLVGVERLHDRILYIVLTKGVPLRISGLGGRYGTYASVDAELMLLYRRMTGDAVSPLGAVDNPYFLNAKEVSEARPFTHREHDLFLVTRLDGYTVEDALALVDRATGPPVAGDIVFPGPEPLERPAQTRPEQ